MHLDGVPGYKGHDAKDESDAATSHRPDATQLCLFWFYYCAGFNWRCEFYCQLEQRSLQAPKRYFCAPVVIPNGYPAVFFGKEGQFQLTGSQYMLYDPAQPDVYPASFNKEDHSPEAVVALAKQQGARCIKVFL